MKCPCCSNVLITLEFEGFELDRCFECRGIWLDSGELEFLLGAETGNEYVKTMKTAVTSEKGKKCPICSVKMAKMTIGFKNIIFDRCSSHGIWFDRGELEKILNENSADNSGILVNMLQEMLSGDKS
ncbi:MAG TPA: zf-TFIIB domain-containing protein [Desulfomonilia bacterium]|jgi:Zn-finger nucleic acid-binding protein